MESSGKGNKPKVKIRTVLQTLNCGNKNKRYYSSMLLERGISEIRPIFKARHLLGEIDHPVPSGVEATDSYRHCVVLYKNASHIFEDIFIDGKNVMGVVETASTDNGYNLAGLIEDKVPIGFSLRAVGEVKPRGDGLVEVVNPFGIITYDSVSNPSHAEARMVSVIKEGISPLLSENYMADINTSGDQIITDRTSVLVNCLNESNNGDFFNDLEQIIGNLSNVVKSPNLNINEKARKKVSEGYVNKLISLYLSEDTLDSDVVKFVEAQGIDNVPLHIAFKKYLNS